MTRLAAIVALAALGLTGCGGHHHRPRPEALKLSRCPLGRSFMGCASGAAPRPQALKPGTSQPSAPAGCKLPDVSLYQGHPNWWAARPYICGAVAKAGERYFEDPDFAWNWGVLRSLGLWHTSYWFVRAANCAAEAGAYIRVLRSVGYPQDALAGPPVIDMELREAYGLAVCMAGQIHSALGVWPDIYTSPGTWPGGSAGGLQAWIATFGRSHGCLPWTCTFVAWQFASPPYVYYYVPGLGYVDESVDLGFTRQRPFYRPLRCFGAHAATANATCRRVRGQVASWTRARDSSHRAYLTRRCDVLDQRDGWFAAAIKSRTALNRRLLARHRRALAATRRAEARLACGTFHSRYETFSSLIAQTERKYG